MSKYIVLITHLLLLSCAHTGQGFQRKIASQNSKCDELLRLILSADDSSTTTNPPMKQLRLWEQRSNTKRWKKPITSVELDYVLVDPKDLNIKVIDLPLLLRKKMFTIRGQLRWFRHPGNTSMRVPYLDNKADGTIDAHYSASRSMFVSTEDENFFSFKLPTNHPHPVADAQNSKANLKKDNILSIRRAKQIKQVNNKTKKPDNLIILTELISITSKKSGNGFTVRDLRPLQDGNYYLPAFSIPYIGKEIAKHNDAHFQKLWGTFYAKALGAAKAKLLIHYGIQMKTPNAQNWLLQLSPDMKPTGTIVLRDIADSSYVDFVAKNNGAKNYLEKDLADHYGAHNDLDPNYEDSVWQMDEGGIPHEVLYKWEKLHDQAYIDTIKEMLGIKKSFNHVYGLKIFLSSDEGIKLIQDYALRNNLIY
jgi:hypothetical protein